MCTKNFTYTKIKLSTRNCHRKFIKILLPEKRKEGMSTNQPQLKSWLNNKIKLSYTILDKVTQLILSLIFLHSFTLLHTFCEKLKLSVEVCFLHSRIFINSFVCIRCVFIMSKQNYRATSTFLNNTCTYVKVLIQRFDSK